MGTTVLQTIQDCEDFIEGALWMGTGGGGSYEEGIELLKEVINEGLALKWVDAEDIPNDIWTVTVGLHGSIAPLSEETLLEISYAGLKEARDEWYLVKAIKELGGSLNLEFKCVVPSELGPGSVAIPLAVGARLDIPVVDGDYIGRAVPEENQSTYCLHGVQSKVFAGVDRWGNSVFVKNTVNIHAMERIAKMLAVASYGDIAVATTPLISEKMKQIIVPNTLSQCLQIGQAIRQARDNHLDPVENVLEIIEGWRLFEGVVVKLETEDRDGYFYGTAHIDGTGLYQGQNFDVWFKNENQITWLNGKPWVCSPDLISFIYKENGRGIYNAELKERDDVVVVGIKGIEAFRTEAGLNLTGPKHFNFDIDYIPIENLVIQEVLDGSNPTN
jgi:DUF917 family protein